jgi:EAL domain-containing protein (putative c-di-GMP-specific phosphodiesterase class I)
MDYVASRSLLIESSLHRALEAEEFSLCYQPKILTATGEICGMEALLRWNHPELGPVPPSEFIGIAESTGLIGKIGEWVLREACTATKRWQEDGYACVPVAVNLSSRQFREPHLDRRILAILEETGLAPEFLELEITESTMMHAREPAVEVLTNLRAAGVRVALDDFGTGYSSLGYVKDFPLDTIKIDQSFICDLHEEGTDGAIVQAIVSMAHSLGARVVAEGVEHRSHVDCLTRFGCDEMQGFFFSRPVPGDEFAALLRDGIR